MNRACAAAIGLGVAVAGCTEDVAREPFLEVGGGSGPVDGYYVACRTEDRFMILARRAGPVGVTDGDGTLTDRAVWAVVRRVGVGAVTETSDLDWAHIEERRRAAW